MYKNSLLIIITLLVTQQLAAQSVSLDFPYFKGEKWIIKVFQGERSDTIASGALDEMGRAKINLPEKYKDYKGMSQWLLLNGGGVDMILADKEDASISCSEPNPAVSGIQFDNTPQNTYLIGHYTYQQGILAKVEAMRMASEVYKEDTELLPIFNKELDKQEQIYNRLLEETAINPLYAARFAQIVNITRGLPPVLSGGNEHADVLLKDFMLNQLEMQALYTSGHWQTVIDQWLNWYIYNPENEALLIEDYQTLKKRITNKEILDAFEDSVQKSLDSRKRGDLALLTRQQKAPALVQGKLPNKKTILVFYDSSCGSCAAQMRKLSEQYPDIQKKGYEVISIAADSDKELYERTANTYPWKNKYCDLKGFAGKDFINYSVMGTPTFYLIDEKGIIKGIYAQVEDMKIK